MSQATHRILLIYHGTTIASYQTADVERSRQEAQRWKNEGEGRSFQVEPIVQAPEEIVQREPIPSNEYLTQERRGYLAEVAE